MFLGCFWWLRMFLKQEKKNLEGLEMEKTVQKSGLGTLAEVKVSELRQTQKQRNAGVKEETAVAISEEFEIALISDEEIEAGQKAAEEAKRLAESLGKQEVVIRATLGNLLSKSPDWNLLPAENVVRREIERLTARLKELSSIEGNLGEHKDFSALLAGIREVNAEDDRAVSAVMTRLVEEYYKIYDGGKKPEKWPAGTIFLYDKIYLSCRNEDGSASSRQRALEAEVRKMTDAHKKSRVAKVKGGNTKLDQFVRSSYADKYTFYSPSRVVPAKDGRPEREYPEGWVLVSLENVNKGERGKKAHWVFDILDAIGSCSWLAKDGKKRMPHFWLLAGRPITGRENRIEEREFKISCSKIGALRGMIWSWCEKEVDKEKAKAVRELLEASRNRR